MLGKIKTALNIQTLYSGLCDRCRTKLFHITVTKLNRSRKSQEETSKFLSEWGEDNLCDLCKVHVRKTMSKLVGGLNVNQSNTTHGLDDRMS